MPVLNAAARCRDGGQTGPPCTAPEDICTAISHRAILIAASRIPALSPQCRA
jgi:hypothetical protein